MRQISSAEIQRSISRGNTKLEDNLLGRVVFVRDIRGVSKGIKEVEIYDLTSRGEKHVIHIGTKRACDLRPVLENGEMHPDAQERHGHIYAEKGKVYFVTEKRTLVDSGSQRDDGTIDEKSWNAFACNGKPQRLEWSLPEYRFSCLGICAGPIATKPEFKLFYIPKDLDY